MGLLLAIFLVLVVLPVKADAFDLAIHDQGASPPVLIDTAEQLGVHTARIIIRTTDPQSSLVRAYRAGGLQVQAAILVKRWTTPGDIRGTLRAWDGAVRTVSIGNEPELNGLRPCAYARLYRRAYSLIRREFPGIRVGFGEFSPFRAVEYTQDVLKCQGPKLRADFWAIHPYQPTDDPLAHDSYPFGDYWGIGELGRVHHFLRAARKRLSTRIGGPPPIRVTEFSYFSDGDSALTPDRAAWMWTRAIQQARRWSEQLVIYGLGVVHPSSRWRSASILDRFGQPLPSMFALARAMGRTLMPRAPLAPAGDLITDAPAPLEFVPVVPIPVGAEVASDEPAPSEPVPEPEAPPVVIADPVLEEPVP